MIIVVTQTYKYGQISKLLCHFIQGKRLLQFRQITSKLKIYCRKEQTIRGYSKLQFVHVSLQI